MSIRRWLTASLLALSLGGPALAQDAPEKPAVEQPEQIKEFRAERLEALRYRHLWIAYGGIWLIVFFFVFRTWSQGKQTASELDDLRARLFKLEGKDG